MKKGRIQNQGALDIKLCSCGTVALYGPLFFSFFFGVGNRSIRRKPEEREREKEREREREREREKKKKKKKRTIKGYGSAAINYVSLYTI